MSKTEKAHPTVGAVEQAQAGDILADDYSHNHYTSNPVTGQPRISDFLGTGRQNASTMQELRKVINSDSRAIRLQIEAERRSGIPILSGQDGYWLAASPTEVKMFVRSMNRRAREIVKTADAIKVAAGID